MRKRLIEKFTKSKEGSLGYTLTELLVVIAIIAIVVAIAIPSVIAISRALKFKRVNDHAKSIFLAAQQNLTEMRSDGGLKPLQEAGGSVLTNIAGFPEEYKTEYVYTSNASANAAFELILPAGSVDGTVRAEQIIIEYNPITGNVYSVFYSEEDESILSDYQSQDGLPRDDKDARKRIMLGYYDGSGLNSSQIELEKTQASVEFVNGEEGIVRVLVPVPDDFFSSVDKYAQALEIDLTVTGEYSMVKAAENPPAENETAPVISFSMPIKDSATGLGPDCYVEYGNTIVVEYPIDSLVNMGSFANHSSNTYNSKALTEQMDETGFAVLPGENITIQADVTVDTAVSEVRVEVESGILSGVNPMFEYLQPSGSGGYVLAVSNGRNLQNLNAIAPTIAKQVDSVVFTSDIYWNDTVSYYNDKYDAKTSEPGYQNNAAENPARALPYFVPIHNEGLFGTAKFIFPGEGDGGLGGILQGFKDLFDKIGEVIFGGFNNDKVPTLTDEKDAVDKAVHASIQGNGHKVYNLNIDSNLYTVPNVGEKGTTKNPQNNQVVETDLTGTFYATGENQIIDYHFTGLFGYVNTPIADLHVVNPIVKGHAFDDAPKTVVKYDPILGLFPIGTETVSIYSNPATGALVGAGGYNTVITGCSTYIDKDARGYVATYLGHGTFNKNAVQTWYGVSGEGAVGGLVGYAKSHRSVNGELTNDKAHLAFLKCFAAVPVSGNMRTADTAYSLYYNKNGKDLGYSNGVGAFIGNSQLTNFYDCYASGDVKATNCVVHETDLGGFASAIGELFGMEMDLLYNGRNSWGAGGFVGTSHGTRYSNCFATGDVTATANGNYAKGAGGFVGFMSLDETSAYGNNDQIAQKTVFTNCYAVGLAVTNSTTYENFSGANGRIVFDPGETYTYFIGDYYRLYAPYYYRNNGAEPHYGNSTYIYRDTYFLNYGRGTTGNGDSSTCAEPESYDVLRNLPAAHTRGSAWIEAELAEIKSVPVTFFGNPYSNYDKAYFQRVNGLDNIYRRLYTEGYSSEEWGPATATTTHPYTVSASGAVYPFSKLVGMDYYGDWPSKPSEIGMAYYEQYVGDKNTDNSYKTYYLFDKERGDIDTRLALRDGEDVFVAKDGYAIFSASSSNLVVTVGNTSVTLENNGESFTIEGKKYYAFILSDELMAKLPADGEFYIQVSAKHVDSDDTYTMYFNPNVALSHANPANGSKDAEKPDAAPKTIYVRSARQFKALTTLDDFWGANYSYIQQLNIDATKYDDWGTEANAAKRQVTSIGEANKPFNASYSAGYTVIGDVAKQYKLTGFQFADNASGFFGVVGTSGSIENLIVECAAPSVGGNTVSDVAVLAGRNAGTISNVDVTIGDVTLTAQDNAGLLAGYSSGTICNCEVTAAAVTVNAKNGGGLTGSAVGTANAKAAVSGCKLTLTGNLTVNGADNAGGLIGHASHLTLSANEPLVTLTNMTANGAYAGGLAGWMENSEIKITDTADAVTVTVTSVKNANGYAAGVLGGGKTVTLNGVDINAGTIEGKIAAGFLGTGTDIDATYCDVVITNSVKGTEKAAGVAGTIGAQSVFGYVPVTLTNVTVSASEGDAAGYAVEIAKEANVMNSIVTLGGTAKIQASGNAAGYAYSVAGYVGNTTGSTMLSSVVGKGDITGNNAAGFACDITGQVSGAFVTPALDSSKYLGNSNNNLTVTGTTSAAGFALSVGADATVTNCYALNKLICADASGFVATNKGVINGCMANVTIDGGYAFVAENNGTVTRCYGWYGDGNTDETTTVAEVGGKCYSAYFVDLNPVDKEGDIVTLYTADGKTEIMTATELQGASTILAGSAYKWYSSGYYSYPYTDNLGSYLYPMLRDHFGDWITPPQYAFGVAYYELYDDGSAKVHMVDLSNEEITEEQENITSFFAIDGSGNVTDSGVALNNNGTILSAGYAVFGKDGNNVLSVMASGEKLFSRTMTTKKTVTYDFYPLNLEAAENGLLTINVAVAGSSAVTLQTYFADAINVTDNTYQVRTLEQLAKIGAVSANFNQTHDIAVTDFTTASIASGKTYNGNKLKLSVSGQTQTWLTSVGGTVEGLNLVVSGGVNAPVFGSISKDASVTLSGLTVDTISANGALAETVTGTMKVPAISPAAVSGKLFGDSTGTIETGAITVTGETAQLFGKVGKVTVTGDIQAKANAGQLFGEVTGAVNTKAITVTGTAAQVFGDVTGGSVTVDGAISVGGTAKVFGTVGAPVEVKGLITTGNLTGNAIGAVSANLTLNGITVGNVPAEKYVIASIGSGTVATGNVTVQNVEGQVFGNVGGTVTVGAVSTQAVGTAAEGETAGKNANIFGNITGGTVTVDSITTNGKDVNGNVFGSVGGALTVTDGITTGAVTGNVFGEITAKTTVASISTGAAGNIFNAVKGEVTVTNGITAESATQVFGNVESGKVTTDSITVTGAAGQIFGTVKAPVTVNQQIKVTGSLSGNVFGAVTAKVTVKNGINVPEIAADKYVVASVGTNGDVSTGNVVATAVKGNVFGTVTAGKLTAGTITVDSVAKANAILAKVEGGTVTLGEITIKPVVTKDEEGNVVETKYADVPTLIGPVSTGSVSGANVTLGSAKITGSIFASVTSGTVQNFNVTTTGAMNAPLVGGELGGTLKSMTVNCGSADVANGVLVNSVKKNAKVESCAVKVTGEVKASGAAVGGLTGTNAGTLTGNTVNIGKLTATGTNTTVGGLVGSNSGAISGADVTAAIGYGGEGGVTIGGIVGDMTGGSLTDSKASGSIVPTANQSGKANAIGGAIGKISAGSVGDASTTNPTTVTTAVTVDTKWAGATKQATSDTFGAGSALNKGPVGMFVGYAAGVTFTDCSSTAANSIYQFIGEAAVTTTSLTNIWKSTVKNESGAKAYSDNVEDGSYTSFAPAGITFSSASSITYVDVTLDGCYFQFNDIKTQQLCGAGEYYYSLNSAPQDSYEVAGNAVAPTYTSVGNKEFTSNDYTANADPVATDFFYWNDNDNQYYQVYVQYVESGSGKKKTRTFKLLDSEGNELASSPAREKGNGRNKYYYAEFGPLFIQSLPELSGYYIAVNGDGKMVDKAGNSYTVPTEAFEQRDAEYTYLWSVSGDTITNVSDSNVSFTMTAAVSAGSTPVMTYTASGITFNLYPVTVTKDGASYELLTFTYLNDDMYLHQFVTCDPLPTAAASLPEETIPAEEIGGETGNNT